MAPARGIIPYDRSLTTTQQYRGYVIAVTSFGIINLYAYQTAIIQGHSGALTHQDASLNVLFGTSTSAEDHAFRHAREWVEANPLPWARQPR